VSTIYHEDDADLAALAGQTIAVVGYGNQGRSQALNLRDSGLDVVIGNLRDSYHETALADGFEVLPIEEASARARVVMLLVPDEVMPQVYAERVAPGLSPGDLVCFASGYNVAFGLIAPAPELDVVLVAPRMIGLGVRDAFVAGRGFPSFVGVHQDATGTAKARMLAICQGIGSTRGGCIEMSMHDEATLDLFTEQGFGPAFGRVMMTAVDLLVEAGYPPEAVLVELYLSGELAYSLEKIREVGMLRQMDFHSHTSQYGSITRGARFLPLGDAIRAKMAEVLEEIRSGRFAEEWSGQREKAEELFARIRAARDSMPMAEWERRARAGFRMGEGQAPERSR
jgi:ketol-acid reductoisomerase